MRRGVGVQVLRHALAHQQQRVDQRGRNQDVEQVRVSVDPEVADGAGGGALDAANQGHGNGDARRGRPEVVRGQAGHLVR
jgi:hypothetical protein